MKRRNKILGILIFMILCLGICKQNASASISGKCGDSLTWRYMEEDEELYIDGFGPMYDYKDDEDAWPRKSTAPWAGYQFNIVHLGDGVTSIGDFAFYGSSVQYLKFKKSSIETIGEYAFCRSALTRIGSMPNLKTIGKSAFSNCFDLKYVSLCEGLETIGRYAFIDDFEDGYSPYGFYIPSTVTSIGEGCIDYVKLRVVSGTYGHSYAVNNAMDYEIADNPMEMSGACGTNLTWRYDGNEGCLYIEGSGSMSNYDYDDESWPVRSTAPWANFEFEYLELANGVTSIGDFAFYRSSVKWIGFKFSELETIGKYAFASSMIEDLCGFEKLKTIKECAFSNCFSLEYVLFEEGLVSIGERAFIEDFTEGYSAENGIYIPTTVTYIGSHAIDAKLKVVCGTYGLTYAKNNNISYSLVDNGNAKHSYKKTVVKATLTKNGYTQNICSGCKKALSKTTIYYPKTFTLSKTSFIYNGKVQKPALTIKGSDGKVISASNYSVAMPKSSKAGSYTVKVTFKGNYIGTKSLTYKILPKATIIKKLTPASKAITIAWVKQTGGNTGYQIQYATNSKFTSAKKLIIKKNTTVKRKITKLLPKKKYYVRIRTYKGSFYSAWSPVKTVVTKK